MYILVTADFEDLEHGKAKRKAGSVLNVEEKRAVQIIKAGYAKRAEVVDLMAEGTEEKKSRKK